MKKEKVFSGERSRPLWRFINAVKKCNRKGDPVGFGQWNVWVALYTLGCRCQELEAKVDRLERRVTERAPKQRRTSE